MAICVLLLLQITNGPAEREVKPNERCVLHFALCVVRCELCIVYRVEFR